MSRILGRLAVASSLASALAFLVAPVIHGRAAAAPQTPATQAAAAATPQADAALIARARGIHDRVITMDTHNDISVNNFTADCNYTMRLTSQVNLPKMVEGGLDVSFMIVYIGQGELTPAGYDSAYTRAVSMFDAIHRLTEVIAPDKIGLALSPADVRRIAASGRKVAVIGVENGYPIGTDIRRVKEFYDRGGRYMSLAHNGHSQLADSNTGEANNDWLHHGLSPLGKEVIAEMNRLGMMVDLSHPSKESNLQAIALSKAPVIASHSAARAVANVSRNADDELLMAIKKNNGVIQTVAFATYVRSTPLERQPAINTLNAEFGLLPGGRGARGQAQPPDPANVAAIAGARAAGAGANPPANQAAQAGAGAAANAGRAAGAAGGRGGGGCSVETPAVGGAPAGGGAGRGGGGGGRGGQNAALETLSPEKRVEYDARMAEIDKKWPVAPRATVQDFVDHIDYLVKKIGIDHVGISSDFDGGGGVTGWNSAAETFNVTLELVKRGYTEAQIAKIWGGNLLRVWSDVEKVAKDIQSGKIK